MAPIVALILGKILDYLADHADEVIRAIKEQFLNADEEVHVAINTLGADPSPDNLSKLQEVLEAKGEDVSKLASVLVNQTTVTV